MVRLQLKSPTVLSNPSVVTTKLLVEAKVMFCVSSRTSHRIVLIVWVPKVRLYRTHIIGHRVYRNIKSIYWGNTGSARYRRRHHPNKGIVRAKSNGLCAYCVPLG